MKTPDDTHISERDCRFADNKLPIDAVLYGFTIDGNGDTTLINRLQALAGDNQKSA